jgi:hypothetical protein
VRFLPGKKQGRTSTRVETWRFQANNKVWFSSYGSAHFHISQMRASRHKSDLKERFPLSAAFS